MVKLIFAVGVVVVAACPSLGNSAEKANHSSSDRICYVKIGDTPKRLCKQLIYLPNPPMGYSTITAKTDDGDFDFAGPEVDSSTISVKAINAGSNHINGSGTCKLTIFDTGRVSKVDCTVQTEAGTAILKSTGVGANDFTLRIGRKMTRAEIEKWQHDHLSSKRSSE